MTIEMLAEVLRVLASIARRGKPPDRLRAAELIGRQLGMFREPNGEGMGVTLEQLVPKRIPRPRGVEAELVGKDEVDAPVIVVLPDAWSCSSPLFEWTAG